MDLLAAVQPAGDGKGLLGLAPGRRVRGQVPGRGGQREPPPPFVVGPLGASDRRLDVLEGAELRVFPEHGTDTDCAMSDSFHG